MLDEEELREMQKLNIELMDTLVTASIGFLEFCKSHDIRFSGLDGLASLIAKAGRICEEIGKPYHKNPVIDGCDGERKSRKRSGHLMLGIIFLVLLTQHAFMLSAIQSVPNGLPHPHSPNDNDALPEVTIFISMCY